MGIRRVVPVVCLLVVSACSSQLGHVRKAAAVDLSCPSNQLEVEQLSKDKKGLVFLAQGCGKSTQYTAVKKTITRSSDIVALPPPPAPAPVAAAAAPTAPTPTAGKTFADALSVLGAVSDVMATASNVTAEVDREPSSVSNSAASSSSSPVAVTATSSATYYACLNGAYYSCPSAQATSDLSSYAACRFRCMSGSCNCTQGAGASCSRDSGRDNTCK